ncbi:MULTISPECIES: hypothetical protein [unclassified Streptomyces]|uniref:hypothetical protein n=1 Tax=unclassified Streptomyces TaxID=2593676 RepID=UPI002E30D82A|nr:hypothetical protein [Streptomyces sp. NBC_01268]
MKSSSLAEIDALVRDGRIVMSGDDTAVVAAVQDALRAGRSVTFYLSPGQAETFKAWYWSPRRIKDRGMEPVSREERERITSELGVKDIGPAHSNRIDCECGAQYGAFEFIGQGIKEHGKESVDAVLDLEHTYVLRVNPTTPAVCATCGARILVGHEYDMTNRYGCCRSENPV